MTDDDLLSPEILENVYAALQAEQVTKLCRGQTGAILESLLKLTQTTGDSKVRREAAPLLTDMIGQLLEASLDVSKPSTDQPGAKQI